MRITLPLVCLLAACASSADDPLPTPALHTPRWAFRPWISKDISTTDDSYGFVNGFLDRQIPVGVLVLDSPWETDYNTFIPNPVRYHDFAKLRADLQAKDVRMVLWTTQMMNQSSYDLEQGGDTYTTPNALYREGRDKGYFVDRGNTYGWWKGTGAGLDFFNAEARAWWHKLQDPLLELGVNGWKLDFGEEYITLDEIPTKQGLVPHQTYSEEYYRDFFAYGVPKRGADEFVTMVRPWDKSYQWEGRFYARPEHAPVLWVGDNRRDWIGLADALDEIFRSAAAGYVVLGSDIGGYLDVDDKHLLNAVPFDAEVFMRWLALGAVTPFMQLHGRANLEPWALPARSDEAVANYRYWASLHEALVPYFYSVAEEAYAGRGKMLTPLGAEASWAGDYRFTVGPAFFCAPILDGTGARSLTVPDDARWYDWWDDAAPAIEPGVTVTRNYVGDSRKIPLFLREGSIVPLDGNPAGQGISPTLGRAIGLPDSGGALVALVTPGPTKAQLTVHDVSGEITLEVERSGNAITIGATGLTRPLLLRVRAEAATVSANGAALPARGSLAELSTQTGAFRDPALPYTWVRVASSTTSVTLI